MRNLWVCIGLVILVFAVYWPVRNFEFVNYDDEGYIYENPITLQGLNRHTFIEAFTRTDQANYHPLIWISLGLDVSIFGPHPRGFHLENVFLHAVNSALLFVFLIRATNRFLPALFTALIFAVHPVHVESVAWVTERKDVLSGLFFMLGLLCYVWYVRTSTARLKTAAYLLTILMLILGLLAKQMLVTFPFVLLLLDYWPLQRNRTWWRLTIEKLPMLPFCAGACVATFLAQHAGGAVVNLDSLRFSERIANAVLAYVRYLGKIFWPSRLSVFYPRIYDFSAGIITVSVALILLITIGCFVQRRRRPFLLIGWLFFLGSLVPVIGLVQVGWQSIADRYLYLPLIGPVLVVVYALDLMLHRRRYATAFAFIAVTIALASVTRHQLQFWHDTRTLFTHAIAVTGPNTIAHVQLGYLDSRSGNVRDARRHFEEAVRIEPTYFVAQFDLANLLLNNGQPDLAIEHYRAAAASQPGVAKIQNNWGIALLHQNKPAEAFEHFREAEKIDPQSTDAHFNLGQLYLQARRFKEAEAEFRETLKLDKDHAGALKALESIRVARLDASRL